MIFDYYNLPFKSAKVTNALKNYLRKNFQDMSAQLLLYFIIAFIVLDFALTKVLAWLNLKTWDQPLPEEVKDLYDNKKYNDAKNYAAANFKLDMLSSSVSIIITVTFLCLHGFAWIDNIVRGITSSAVLQTPLFFGILGFAAMLISMPFEIYETFVVEERFGFNKMTPKLYVTDKLKSLALAIILGGGLLMLLTYLYGLLGDKFWIAAWIVMSVVIILVSAFYTSLLLPIFNKLKPLENGELRQSIEQYAAKVRFPLTNILVMDGSKRSTKANAFFSGFGNKKNIVLYDNLIKDMNLNEVTAVLAHEVGHYKKKHVLQSLVITVLQLGLMFFLFGWLAGSPLLAEALGAKQGSFYLSLVAFALLYSPVSMLIGLMVNMFSRKNEYEADAFAKETYGAGPLISSLKKLSVNHLVNLQPHPAYVFFNYSHPTLLQRMKAVK